MLRGQCRVIVQTQWDERPADAMIALHARRSADSVESFHSRHPERGLAVVLTGTDLYGDLPANPQAIRSLDLATHIVTLQDEALRSLEPRWRRKARAILQSAPAMRAPARRGDRLDCVAAGHLRPVKDPTTLYDAVRRLPRDLPIRVRHFGAPLDETLAVQARELSAQDPRYRYEGAKSHRAVRNAIAAAHLLLHPSLLEGGANVIVEAVTAGTAVLASRMPGNVGMLGRSYSGYFDVGDAEGLARLLRRALAEPAFLARLGSQCRKRRPLFSPAAETRALRALVRELTA